MVFFDHKKIGVRRNGIILDICPFRF